MKRIIGCIMCVCCTAIAVQAQYDTQFSQYYTALGYYNPAAAGRSGDLNVMAMYRLQWLGIKNAPQTIFAAADMPISFMKREHGVGITVRNEQFGVFNELPFGLQYAYIRKRRKGTIRIGLQGGLLNSSSDGTKIIIPEGSDDHSQTDEAIPTSQVDGKSVDFNAGL